MRPRCPLPSCGCSSRLEDLRYDVARVTGTFSIGQEWLIDASGCDVGALKDVRVLSGLFEELIVTLGLSVVGTPQWHVFPEPGGVTGLALLSESHLAIHTFPEHRYAALSIYSCSARAPLDFTALLQRHLSSSAVGVRTLAREAGK